MGAEVSIEYLQALLTGHDYQSWLRNHGVGTTKQTRVRLDDLRKLPIPVPPREMQERIVRAHARTTGHESIEDMLQRLTFHGLGSNTSSLESTPNVCP